VPPAIVALAAAVAGGAAAAAIGGIGGAIVGAIISTGIGLLGSAIFPAPKPKATGENFNIAGGGRTEMVREPIRAHTIIYGRVRVGGTIIFIHTKADNLGRADGFLYMAVVLAGHRIDAVEDIFLDNVSLSDPKYAGIARVTPWLGADTQVADPDWLAEISEKWTADHRLRGRAWLACRFRWDATAFRTGVPKVTAVVRGRQVFDPRTGQTAWSANSALCAADWLETYRGIPRARIGTLELVAAASIADEAVALRAGGTERRYETHGTLEADDDPRTVLPKLAAPMAGAIVNTGGTWGIFAGAWSEPVQTLTLDDLRGDVTLNTRRQRRDLFNGIRATFVNPKADWQPVDAPPLLNPGYVADDGDVEQYSTLEMPFTTSPAMVQRLMAIALERNRRQRSVSFPANLSALALRPWDVVEVDLGRLGGFTTRVAGWTFSAEGGIDLVLEEEDSLCWAWDPAQETPMADAPSVSFGGSLVPAPSEINIAVPGAVGFSSIAVTWAQVTAVTVQDYELQHRPASGGDWTSVLRTVANASVAAAVPTEFRVRARDTSDRASAWTEALVPGPPFSLTAGDGGLGAVALTWSNGERSARVQIFRNSVNSTVGAPVVAEPTGASFNDTGLGEGSTWYYWLRSVTAQGNFSGITTAVVGTAGVTSGGGDPPPGGGGGPTCFPPGTPVLRADGTWVPIEQVRPGDLLRGGRGEVNEVLALDISKLAGRPLWRINGHHLTTAEHRHLTIEGWASIDPAATQAEHMQVYPVILADGSVIPRQLVKFTRTEVSVLRAGDVLRRWDGVLEPIATMVPEPWHAPALDVHSLVMAGSHTFVASGFVVSGWARDDDFDYATWAPRASHPQE
jgi:hypothetical protein